MSEVKQDKMVCEFHPEINQVAVSGRLLWPELLVPSDGGFDNGKLKYSTHLLLPKCLDLGPLIKLEADAAAKLHGPNWQKVCNHRALFKTADSKYEWLAALADEFPMYLKASQDHKLKPVLKITPKLGYEGDGSDIYSGRWARLFVDVWAYKDKSNGVKFGPKTVFLRMHDTKLGKEFAAPADDLGDLPQDMPQDADAIWNAA